MREFARNVYILVMVQKKEEVNSVLDQKPVVDIEEEVDPDELFAGLDATRDEE